MLTPSPGNMAWTCRSQASYTTNALTRDTLLKMAAEYERLAAMDGPVVNALFLEEPAGTFKDGYIFRSAPDLTSAQQKSDSGYWSCDVVDQNRLTWSDKVYELFGLPHGAPIERGWAVGRYSDQSRTALDRVRKYALSRDFGFILDAEIEPEGADRRWIRVLAVPVVENGRIVQLHGIKRPL